MSNRLWLNRLSEVHDGADVRAVYNDPKTLRDDVVAAITLLHIESERADLAERRLRQAANSRDEVIAAINTAVKKLDFSLRTEDAS